MDVPEAELQGYDACFFCLGVSSAGMSEADYTRLTYDLTLAWARPLARVSPGMAFLYVSGAGTGGQVDVGPGEGTDRGGAARALPRGVHGAAGDAPPGARRGLADAVGARPVRGARPARPAHPGARSGMVITSEELGRAMIRAARERPPTHVLEMRDLQALARG